VSRTKPLLPTDAGPIGPGYSETFPASWTDFAVIRAGEHLTEAVRSALQDKAVARQDFRFDVVQRIHENYSQQLEHGVSPDFFASTGALLKPLYLMSTTVRPGTHMQQDPDELLAAYPLSRRGHCLIATMKFGDCSPPFKADLPARAEDYERALLGLGFDKQRIVRLDDVNSGSVNSELGRLAASAEHNPLDCLVVILICEYGFLLTPPSGVVHPGVRSEQGMDSGYYRYGSSRYSVPSNQTDAVLENPLRPKLRLHEEVFSRFSSDRCPALAGKPRLFIVHTPREMERLDCMQRIRRHHFGFMLNPGGWKNFYILYAPLPFMDSHRVPNPAQELAKAMLTAGQQNSDRGAELTDMVLELMAKVGDSGCAEIAMPKVFSTLTKLVRFPASDGR
uniref:CASPASE_P20 domain-containing protein n=1 Tax=Macrostomum lignano TaxID=282301 RepID=A0A1I8I508_9PLAT